MRIFLLPVSTRRSLLYCERLQSLPSSTSKPPFSERIISRAALTWAEWERADKGWRKYLVVQGNRLLSRIAYEEWGLKSFPPLTKSRIEDLQTGKLKVDCLYPSRFLSSQVQNGSSKDSSGVSPSEAKKDETVHSILSRLALERQELHRRRMWTSIVIAPFTIPFALVPVIPNIPFFYLCFRAYSHYRALYGGKFLAHLLATPGLLAVRPSEKLDELYTRGLLAKDGEALKTLAKSSPENIESTATNILSNTEKGTSESKEKMLLRPWSGRLLAGESEVPEMQVEIERAVAQVEAAIAKASAAPAGESENKEKPQV